MSRFTRPTGGPATPVRFPTIVGEQLTNGLRVWTVPYGAIPVATVTLLLSRGTANDPADKHGLASLTGDLLDEGAGSLDAIGLAEAFARLGTQLDIDVGPDARSSRANTPDVAPGTRNPPAESVVPGATSRRSSTVASSRPGTRRRMRPRSERRSRISRAGMSATRRPPTRIANRSASLSASPI